MAPYTILHGQAQGHLTLGAARHPIGHLEVIGALEDLPQVIILAFTRVQLHPMFQVLPLWARPTSGQVPHSPLTQDLILKPQKASSMTAP